MDNKTKNKEEVGEHKIQVNLHATTITNNNCVSTTTADKEEDKKSNAIKLKKKSKMKSAFNSVLRSLKSGADKLLTNFLSSGNYNRLIIATSAVAAGARSSLEDSEDDEDGGTFGSTNFRCGPHHATIPKSKL